MKTLEIIFCGLACVGIGACGAAPDADELSSEESSLGNSLTARNMNYYALRQDMRRCIAPLCGGLFVRQVNQDLTVCEDGSRQKECYVAELDLNALRLDDAGEAEVKAHATEFLMRGTLRKKAFQRFGRLGVFRATEAFRGHPGQNPDGSYYRVNDMGIVCVTTPCFSLSAIKLNLKASPETFAGINLTGIGEDQSDARAQMRKADGLLIAARTIPVSGPGGQGAMLEGTEYYLPFAPKTRTGENQPCGSRGLLSCAQGQYCRYPVQANCGRADAAGVCANQPQFCTALYDPVCGCNGMTYSNACNAASQGVSVDYQGACRTTRR